MKSTLMATGLSLGLLFPWISDAKNDLDQMLDKSFAEAESRGLTYLPQFIVERKTICAHSPPNEKNACMEKLQRYSSEILSCPSSTKRFREGISYDQKLAQETFLQNEPAILPPEISDRFRKLISVVHQNNRKPFTFKFELKAYKSAVKNAHAAVSGNIYLSEGLWTGPEPLSIPEVTAIMAHEIAHVIHLHGMTLNCMALEWTGPQFSVSEAHQAFREDMGGVRQEMWSKVSQGIEYEADAVATFILKKAGFDPLLMVRALEKLKPKEQGFTSGSHPDFEQRIQAARKAAMGL